MFKFSKSQDNAKLKHLFPKLKTYLQYLGNNDEPVFYSFSKLSGHDCPYAKECLSKAVVDSQGRKHVQDGPDSLFRCFSASQEVIFPAVYNQRKHNSDYMKEVIANSTGLVPIIARKIAISLPAKANVIRIHVGGDFKVQAEFDAWMLVAKCQPIKLFYAYTKSIPFWVNRLGSIPRNLVLTASYGGHKDNLIRKHELRHATVVDTPGAAWLLRQPIDHDDSHAANPISKENFCLLVHGPQKANTYRSSASYNNRGQYV